MKMGKMGGPQTGQRKEKGTDLTGDLAVSRRKDNIKAHPKNRF